MYERMKPYVDLLPDFPLFFTFAKRNAVFRFIYPMYWKDIFQIITLSILSEKENRKRNNKLQRELYQFGRHILGVPFRKKNRTIKHNSICKEDTTCDLCKKTTKTYKYKSILPGKIVCKICYKNIRNRSQYCNCGKYMRRAKQFKRYYDEDNNRICFACYKKGVK